MSAGPVPRVRALECPSCGGTVELRGHAHTLNAVCVQCLSIIDAQSPDLKILQKFSEAQRHMPLVPLGSRGKLGNAEYEAIGFQVREIIVDEVAYQWREYLLYNPFRGYLYLTEYDGHWNVIRTIRSLPVEASRRKVVYGGTTYKHFQNAVARTVFVMGEFPWQVRVGDSVTVDDYVAPPHALSAERTEGEVVWSLGTYTPAADIWQAFKLTGQPPMAKGVYSNQPNPHPTSAAAWRTFALLTVLFLVAAVALAAFSFSREVFRQRYYFDSSVPGERSFVTPVFDLPGRTSPVTIRIHTDLDNDWAFFAVALINDETGVAYDGGREVSYFYGRDSDGRWTEGNQRGEITFRGVPAGRYYMRVEPDADDDGRRHAVNYELVAARGGVSWIWFLLAFTLLPIPPIWAAARRYGFESTRWAESDYSGTVEIG